MNYMTLLILLSTSVLGLEEPYKIVQMENICQEVKTVVSLQNQAAILNLNINHLAKNFSCHIELEVAEGFGFHAYIQEMNFRGSESSEDFKCKEDFLLLAHNLFLSSQHSGPKYCGHYPLLDYTPVIGDSEKSNSNFPRMYVEKNNLKMDVWFKLSPEYFIGPRSLTLVITPFKKQCQKSDFYYKMCSHSTHCIHKDYFCDDYVNCAWSEDEEFCSQRIYYYIPLIILAIIIFLILLVTLAVKLQIHCRWFKKSDETNVDRHRRAKESTELYEGSPWNPFGGLPSTPPSYEDVVSNDALMQQDSSSLYTPI